jgi:hypothetical protein
VSGVESDAIVSAGILDCEPLIVRLLRRGRTAKCGMTIIQRRWGCVVTQNG